MSSKRTSRQDRRGSAPRRKAQITIVVIVVVSLFAAWTMLASSGALNLAFRQKATNGGTVSLASLNSNSPSKEYIYAGGRLVATEEPQSPHSGVTVNYSYDAAGNVTNDGAHTYQYDADNRLVRVDTPSLLIALLCIIERQHFS